MASASENDHQAERVAPLKVRAAPAAEAQTRAPRVRPDHAAVLAMQRRAGNQAVVAMLRGQVSPNNSRPARESRPPPAIPTGEGTPLGVRDRVGFEQALGHPLGHVRVHSGQAEDEAARALGADAFTVGSHVYFADGALAPGTAEGDRKLGHELIHVVQHDAGDVPRADSVLENGLVSSPSDRLEQEAYSREGEVARKASALRGSVSGAAITPAQPPPQVSPTVVHLEAALAPAVAPSRAASLGPGPRDDQLLPTVSKGPPPIGRSGGAPVRLSAAAPGAPVAPLSARPPAPPASAVAAVATPPAPTASRPMGPAPVTDWVAPPEPAGGAEVPPEPTPAVTPGAVTQQGEDTPVPGNSTATGTRIAAYITEASAFTSELEGQKQVTVEALQVEVARLVAAGHAAAAEARGTLVGGYDEQLQAVPAATSASLAAIAAAAQRERASISAAAGGERQRLATAHDAERQEAVAHIEGLRQQTLAAGETQAARAIDASEQRAAAITKEGAAAPTTGEPPSAEAQSKSAKRIAERAADQCRQTGTKVAGIVRQEAAHHAATNYDAMLRDYLAKLDQSRSGAEQAITQFVQTADKRVDEITAQATTAARTLGDQTLATLKRERAAALAEVDAWEAQAPAALEQAGAQAREAMAAQFAQLGEEVPASAAANAELLRPLSDTDQVEAMAELGQNLQAGREMATSGLGQLRDAAVAGMSESFEQLNAELRVAVEGRRSAAQTTGAKTLQGLQAGAEGAAQGMAGATVSFRQRLTAGVTESVEKLTNGGGEFRSRSQGIHDKALKGLAQAVDDGLASEDALLAKARAEMAAVPGKVDAKYTDLKGQAEAKSASEQPVPATRIHRGLWDSITGWVSELHESAKKWFADTFGEILGGLLLGILEGLIIVGVGLLLSWAVGAIVGAVIVSGEVAAIVTVAILLAVAIPLGIYNRFQEFYEDNPGEDAGFWRGLGLVGLGILDLTGLPFIIEGLAGQRAFGKKMSKFDANERLGMGIVFFGAALVSLKNILRAKPKVIEKPRVRPQPEPHPNPTPPAGLTPKLEAIRVGLKDPRAIEQFDNMFSGVKGDSAKMEKILDGFARKGPVEDRLIADWQTKNPTPEPPRGDALDQVPLAKAKAVALREEMIKFQESNPKVEGMADRIKAIDGEIQGFDEMLDGRLEASSKSLTGREANVDGIRKEFDLSKRTSGLTGVSRRFSLDGRPEAVEVDVVGDKGKLWIDSKSTEPFGLDSNAWKGKPGKQGLEVQAREMLRAAQQNPVDGVPPKVAFDFPKGVSKEVKAALEAMGIEVRGPVIEPKPIPVPVPHGGDEDKDGGT